MKKYIIDCEVYSNYFLTSVMDTDTKEVLHFELSEFHTLDRKGLKSLLDSSLTISFNGFNFDLPIIVMALRSKGPESIKKLCDAIIKSNLPAWKTAKDFDIQIPAWNHIDLIEVCPGKSSLKIYGARLHQKKLEDLPIAPDTVLTRDQMEQVRAYCVNDLETTLTLARALEKQLALRVSMSHQYGIDLRSKSDAQIAETVILSELETLTHKKYKRPDDAPESFRYSDPKILSFETETLRDVFNNVLSTTFALGGNGAVTTPDWMKEPIVVSGARYQMGIGGLHSMETAQYVKAEDDDCLLELDVASYYPSIILQQRMAPSAIGAPFLQVYRTLVEGRLQAKKGMGRVLVEIREIEEKLKKLDDIT